MSEHPLKGAWPYPYVCEECMEGHHQECRRDGCTCRHGREESVITISLYCCPTCGHVLDELRTVQTKRVETSRDWVRKPGETRYTLVQDRDGLSDTDLPYLAFCGYCNAELPDGLVRALADVLATDLTEL